MGYEFTQLSPGTGGTKVAGETFVQGVDTLFMQAAVLCFGPDNSTPTRVTSVTPLPVDTDIPDAITLSSVLTPPPSLPVGAFGYVFGDGTWNRIIEVQDAHDSFGVGTPAVGPLFHRDDNLTFTVGNNKWSPPRISERRAMLIEGTPWQGGIPPLAVLTSEVPLTSQGLTPHSFVSAAAVYSASVKAFPGQVYGMQFFNKNASPRFVRLYDQTTAPVAGDSANIKWRGMVPGNTGASGCVIPVPPGTAFLAGIGMRVTAGAADSDNTALTADDTYGNVQYK